MELNYLFLFALLAVAFLYSSVGHGGASGYLALMALFAMPVISMKASALTLNLFVSATSFLAFQQAGYFRWKILLPLVIGSIPLAFLGARTHIDPHIYKMILGVFLLFAVARMVYQPKPTEKPVIPVNFIISVLIGAALGFFSGMIGIGGGIVLSPILLLFGWTNVKETAAISAIFIFLNSASGLMGLISTGIHLNPQIYIWVILAFIGGYLGAWVGSKKLSLIKLNYLLAAVLLLASFKLFFT
uniref:sulfite exporter TauE/SafE family protein n=1 Tax=Candidatus Electrothrix sp. TaxID=2170559 RepID=UPI004057135B